MRMNHANQPRHESEPLQHQLYVSGLDPEGLKSVTDLVSSLGGTAIMPHLAPDQLETPARREFDSTDEPQDTFLTFDDVSSFFGQSEKIIKRGLGEAAKLEGVQLAQAVPGQLEPQYSAFAIDALVRRKCVSQDLGSDIKISNEQWRSLIDIAAKYGPADDFDPQVVPAPDQKLTAANIKAFVQSLGIPGRSANFFEAFANRLSKYVIEQLPEQRIFPRQTGHSSIKGLISTDHITVYYTEYGQNHFQRSASVVCASPTAMSYIFNHMPRDYNPVAYYALRKLISATGLEEADESPLEIPTPV
jgi:hypothetical protein